jgi:hypothetical protein
MSTSVPANSVVTVDPGTAYAVKVTNTGTTALVLAADDGERARGGWQLETDDGYHLQSYLGPGASRLVYPTAFVPVTAAAWNAGDSGQVDVTVYLR